MAYELNSGKFTVEGIHKTAQYILPRRMYGSQPFSVYTDFCIINIIRSAFAQEKNFSYF
jgi:hypothetical protein